MKESETEKRVLRKFLEWVSQGEDTLTLYRVVSMVCDMQDAISEKMGIAVGATEELQEVYFEFVEKNRTDIRLDRFIKALVWLGLRLVIEEEETLEVGEPT
jgi:hypothetical protein